MTRIVLVFLLATSLCLGLTGLRVALLQQMTAPRERLISPRPVKDPAPPKGERPIEYIAEAPAPARSGGAEAVLVWRSALPLRRPLSGLPQ